jgi:hypothetical protein
MTPALTPSAPARTFVLAYDVQNTKALPMVVHMPAAMTSPKARPTLPFATP